MAYAAVWLCKTPSLKRIPSNKAIPAMWRRSTIRSILTKTGDGAGVVPESTRAVEFNLKEYMAAKVRKVNEALDKAAPLRHPEDLHRSMRYTLLGGAGKRVCSLLALASCELVGGAEDAAMPVACAAEMIHDTALILDDLPCMDDADTRRGQAANHKVFGEATAVLSGAALLSLAFEHVASSSGAAGVAADRVARAVAELANACGSEGMVAGQIVDIASEGREVGLGVLEYIHSHKTARLAEAAAVCGAIVGGGDGDQVEKLRRYSRCVGMLFQVVDDILDVTGTPETLGKPAGKDLERGKATYPKLIGLHNAREFAQTLVGKATEELAGFDPERAAPLYSFAHFIADRKR